MKRKRRLPKPMTKEEAQKRLEGFELEKGDVPAMILAAFLVFGPVLLLVIGILVFVMIAFWVR